MNEVEVYAAVTPQSKYEYLGYLQKRAGQHIFSYQHQATEALSLTMPMRYESYQYPELHPIFQMNLPEGALREALERMLAKQYGSDDLSLLALLGNEQIGRLAYAFPKQGIIQKTEPALALEQLLEDDNAALFGQLLARYAQHSGVSGVQPKVLMTLAHHLTITQGEYIVKAWGADYPHLACNEYLCLSIAQAAGLQVPAFYLSENAQLLVTQRFDFDAEGHRLGFEDFCVLQAKGTKQKYDSSLEACTHTIRQFVSPEYQVRALTDFYKLTYLNVRVRNGDAHLKNSGVLYAGLAAYHSGEAAAFKRQLAPVFDIVSTTPYLPKDTMALLLAGSKRWPKLKVLRHFARQHCSLSEAQAEQIETEVDTAISANLALLTDLANQYLGFQPIAERMELNFQQVMV